MQQVLCQWHSGWRVLRIRVGVGVANSRWHSYHAIAHYTHLHAACVDVVAVRMAHSTLLAIHSGYGY